MFLFSGNTLTDEKVYEVVYGVMLIFCLMADF